MLASSAKRALHRDICTDPAVHGLVLNLYLNGEQYPHRVDDYFPLAEVEDPLLLDTMRAHMRDEDKHVALYIKALRKIDQPVRRLPMDSVYNHVIRSHTTRSFRIEPSDRVDTRRERLADFLAHLHFLEVRIARSLEFHLDACESASSPFPGKAVAVILGDERRHADYTRRWIFELLPRTHARTVLASHRRAEARANVEFSSRQLARLLREHARTFPRPNRWLYAGGVWLLERMVNHG